MARAYITAGQLDQRLTIQWPTTTQDELGQVLPGWTGDRVVNGGAEPLRGRELVAAGAQQSAATVRFRIRWQSDITAACRVLWRGAPYAIVSDPIDVRGQRVALELLCTTAGAA
jgi:SPP1 family predicted phage head-tail adaptor